MNCARGVDLLGDYVDGALPLEIRGQIDAHLGVCPRCVAYVESYLHTIRAFRDATRKDPPPEFEKALRDRLA